MIGELEGGVYEANRRKQVKGKRDWENDGWKDEKVIMEVCSQLQWEYGRWRR